MQTSSDTQSGGTVPAQDGSDDWLAFAKARTTGEIHKAWLRTLCNTTPDVGAGLLLLVDTDGSYAPAAVWPADAGLSYLAEVAQDALQQRRGVVKNLASGATQLAYPLLSGEALFGAVVLDMQGADSVAATRAMRSLHWGVGWLVDLHDRRAMGEFEARVERSAFLFDVVLSALAQPDFAKSALAVANQLAKRFDCHQVLLGVESGKSVRVAAVSHSAWFDEKSNRMNLAAHAMNEAFDQRERIVLPPVAPGGTQITTNLQRYADESGSRSLCVLPLDASNQLAGVWLLERDQPFGDGDLAALETITAVLGPVFELKQAVEESLPAHIGRSWRKVLSRAVDTSNPGAKLIVATCVLLLVFLAFFPVEFRVSSRANVEGEVQRAAVAPFQGYIREAPARAGDIVKSGQTLAVLDDRDLQLERVRWESELEVALRKTSEGMAKAERVAVRLGEAQAGQARAQLELVLEKLERVTISAPFDGVVVRGDLSQELGSPVEQGRVLFELAPLDAWRVILKVDERDIAYLREGARGTILLASLPGDALALKVKKVTPVATADEGRNYFRVEADILSDAAKLRPGMEGVAKVDAGQHSLLWIWTRRLSDWFTLTLWELMP